MSYLLSSLISQTNLCLIIIWSVVFVLALVIELATDQLVSIWFCPGALAALILSCFDNVPFYISIIVFVVVSAISLLLSNLFFRKKLLNKDNNKTNADTLIGQAILITQDVSIHNPGEGKVRDIVWTCKTDSDATIKAGSYAVVVSIKGNSLYVKEKEN